MYDSYTILHLWMQEQNDALVLFCSGSEMSLEKLAGFDYVCPSSISQRVTYSTVGREGKW